MLTVRFHAAIHQLVTDEARVRFGFVPAPAPTYGLDPALGDLSLCVARDGRIDIPVVVSSASELVVPSGPTTVDGFLWTYPAQVVSPSDDQQHLTQAVVVATAFGAPGHTPKLIHAEGTLGPPTLPRASLLRIEDLPAPILLRTTAPPPKVGSRVVVRGRLSIFRSIRGDAGFDVLCLRGTAALPPARRPDELAGRRTNGSSPSVPVGTTQQPSPERPPEPARDEDPTQVHGDQTEPVEAPRAALDMEGAEATADDTEVTANTVASGQEPPE